MRLSLASLFHTLLLLAFLFCLPIPVIAKETMTLARQGNDETSVIQVECGDVNNIRFCSLGGTHIFKTKVKPLGAILNPTDACYIEASVSGFPVSLEGGLYVSKEGPAGSICSTQLITTIDFISKRVTIRKFSDDKTGGFCSQQLDTVKIYTNDDFLKPIKDFNCKNIEAIPSLWAP